MKKSLLEIYALAICFFTVACFSITAGVAIYDVIQIADPELTVDSVYYQRHQSNDEFTNHYCSCDEDDKRLPIAEAELTQKREQSWALTLRSEKHNGVQSLVHMLIIIFIDSIIFLIHWNIAKRARDIGND